MYHGEESGHFILFVNGNIIQIDFKQLEEKTYNFLIENQLIELLISPEEMGFEYVLTPQRPPGTQDVEERTFDKHFWIPLILILVILNLVFYLYKYKSILGIG